MAGVGGRRPVNRQGSFLAEAPAGMSALRNSGRYPPKAIPQITADRNDRDNAGPALPCPNPTIAIDGGWVLFHPNDSCLRSSAHQFWGSGYRSNRKMSAMGSPPPNSSPGP